MQNQFVDLYRNSIKNATDIMRATLESTARLQQQQIDYARQFLDESTKSANQLSEQWANFWNESYAATTRASEQAMRSAGSQMSNVSGALREAPPQQERKAHDQHRRSA